MSCQDVFKLRGEEWRTCQCGRIGGRYIDALNAEFYGDGAVTLGFSNTSFSEKLWSDRSNATRGTEFVAFIIPDNCETFKKVRKPRKDRKKK